MKVRVEKFLREIGTEPAESTSRNPLEQVWSLTAEEFTRRVKSVTLVGRPASDTEHEKLDAGLGKLDAGLLTRIHKSARGETMSATEEIGRVESAIDERVKGLYGVGIGGVG